MSSYLFIVAVRLGNVGRGPNEEHFGEIILNLASNSRGEVAKRLFYFSSGGHFARRSVTFWQIC